MRVLLRRMFEVQLRIKTSWNGLKCVHVPLGQCCKLSAKPPLPFPPPLFQQRLQNIDMIMYLGRSLCSAYIPVFMRSWACVHRSASYLEDRLVEHLTEKVSFFPEEQKQMRALEACESALSSKWAPPLQVDIVLDPWPISFILTTLTVTPHCKRQMLSLPFTS